AASREKRPLEPVLPRCKLSCVQKRPSKGPARFLDIPIGSQLNLGAKGCIFLPREKPQRSHATLLKAIVSRKHQQQQQFAVRILPGDSESVLEG
ncbi:hypothetical protein pipiens_015307, partial [Culex pipiens pipiens]